jgi:hypothetical protein
MLRAVATQPHPRSLAERVPAMGATVLRNVGKRTSITMIESTSIRVRVLEYWREIPTQRTHSTPPIILCISNAPWIHVYRKMQQAICYKRLVQQNRNLRVYTVGSARYGYSLVSRS